MVAVEGEEEEEALCSDGLLKTGSTRVIEKMPRGIRPGTICQPFSLFIYQTS